MSDQKKPQPSVKNTEQNDALNDLPAKKFDGKKADEIKGGMNIAPAPKPYGADEA